MSGLRPPAKARGRDPGRAGGGARRASFDLAVRTHIERGIPQRISPHCFARISSAACGGRNAAARSARAAAHARPAAAVGEGRHPQPERIDQGSRVASSAGQGEGVRLRNGRRGLNRQCRHRACGNRSRKRYPRRRLRSRLSARGQAGPDAELWSLGPAGGWNV